MGNELDRTDYFETQAKIVDLHLRYSKSPAQIAKAMGMKVKDVQQHLNEFNNYAVQNADLQNRARELVVGADVHFGRLIEKTSGVIDEVDKNFGTALTVKDETAYLNAKLKAIATIKDLEMSRIKVMQEAGLLDDEAAAAERLETERKVELITNILREVTADCERCRMLVAERISEIENRAEVID